MQSGGHTWPEWPQIAGTKKFQVNANQKQWPKSFFAEYIWGHPFNKGALAGLAGVSQKNVTNSTSHARPLPRAYVIFLVCPSVISQGQTKKSHILLAEDGTSERDLVLICKCLWVDKGTCSHLLKTLSTSPNQLSSSEY